MSHCPAAAAVLSGSLSFAMLCGCLGTAQAVFARALQECRNRTLAHWKLSEGEQLDVE